MLNLVVAYLGGMLTILSPCILPVIPFVFARADQPFIRSGLPLLMGMALTFTLFGTLAAVAGGWIVNANDYGRRAALVTVGIFGLTMLFPTLSERLFKPIVSIGARLAEATGSRSASLGLSAPLILGVATGLLWTPCAGPILGLVLTSAALNGANVRTLFLLFAYATGAATSLALALLTINSMFHKVKVAINGGVLIRRLTGFALLSGTTVIALGFDTSVLARLSSANTEKIEKTLLIAAGIGGIAANSASRGLPRVLQVEGQMSELSGATDWINSVPLTTASLRGKVVLVYFWTYSCINCLRSVPYVRAWDERYRNEGLAVIGVHTPEFAFEKELGNVSRAAKDLKLRFPIALDSDCAVWKSFGNQYWPALYLVDAQGRIRHHQFGEGNYAATEDAIQQLLHTNAHEESSKARATIETPGAQAAPYFADLHSSETYVGYAQAEHFASPEGLVRDSSHKYLSLPSLALNEWALQGSWTVSGDRATVDDADGRIAFRFHARDLHLVLGPGEDGKPIRFRVTIDGHAPLDSQGVDINAQGFGAVSTQRLYQLVRQPLPLVDRLFKIEFLDPGAQVFVFTFG